MARSISKVEAAEKEVARVLTELEGWAPPTYDKWSGVFGHHSVNIRLAHLLITRDRACAEKIASDPALLAGFLDGVTAAGHYFAALANVANAATGRLMSAATNEQLAEASKMADPVQ